MTQCADMFCHRKREQNIMEKDAIVSTFFYAFERILPSLHLCAWLNKKKLSNCSVYCWTLASSKEIATVNIFNCFFKREKNKNISLISLPLFGHSLGMYVYEHPSGSECKKNHTQKSRILHFNSMWAVNVISTEHNVLVMNFACLFRFDCLLGDL